MNVILIGNANPIRDAWLESVARNRRVAAILMLEDDRDPRAAAVPKARFHADVEAMLRVGADGAVLADEPLRTSPAAVAEMVRALTAGGRAHKRAMRRIVLATPEAIATEEVRDAIALAEAADVPVDAAVPQLLQAAEAFAYAATVGQLRRILFVWSQRTSLDDVLLLHRGVYAAAVLGALAGWDFGTVRIGPTPGTGKRLGPGVHQFDVEIEMGGVAHRVLLESGNRELPGEELIGCTLEGSLAGTRTGLVVPLPQLGAPQPAWTFQVDKAFDMHQNPPVGQPVVSVAIARRQEADRWVASLSGGSTLALTGEPLTAVGRLAEAMEAVASNGRTIEDWF